MQAQIRQLKSEQNFFKESRSPDDNKIIQSIKSQLSEAKEALHIQNEDMERMQMNLQGKDDEIDKLREALDEFDGDDEKVAFCCFSFCCYVRFVMSVFIIISNSSSISSSNNSSISIGSIFLYYNIRFFVDVIILIIITTTIIIINITIIATIIVGSIYT